MQTNGKYRIRYIITKINGLHTQRQNQNNPTKIKYNRLTQQTKEIKNCIYQLRTKLTKVQSGKQNQSKVPSGR